LKAGATLAQAQAEIDALALRLAAEHPREDEGLGAYVQPIREQLFGAVRRPLLILMGAVACVLAIACANAAGLLLGRATARRREIAVRLALGANRRRIVRQLLTESMVLALGGAAAGLLVAWWARSTLVAIAPANVPRLGDAGIDGSVLAFTLGVTIVTGIAFGIVPAWHVSTGALTSDLNDGYTRGSSGPRGARARDVLVAVQIAVALVLLVGAGLLLRSFTTLTRVDVGIDTRNLLTFDLVLSGPRAAAPPARIAFYNDTLDAIRALPGVRNAGAAVTLPIGGDEYGLQYTVEGQPVPSPAEQPSAGFQIVTPSYFTTMGIPLLNGRDFQSSDTSDAQPVAIVSESLARREWPGENPIGKRVRVGRDESNPWMTIVGLVGDVRHQGPAAAPRPELYQPFTQNPFSWMAFVVRAPGDPRSLVPPIRAAIARLDATQPISRASTMEEHVERSLARPHFMSTLIGAFGSLALLLAIVGIYGVIAYSVAQRTREIAIRSALGARRSDVLRLVLFKALWLSAVGIVAGLAASAALTGVLAGQLFGVTPTDPVTYAVVVALLIAVALAAGAIPAARAMRIEAAIALK
jgi:putative ABC transport system permease protein